MEAAADKVSWRSKISFDALIVFWKSSYSPFLQSAFVTQYPLCRWPVPRLPVSEDYRKSEWATSGLSGERDPGKKRRERDSFFHTRPRFFNRLHWQRAWNRLCASSLASHHNNNTLLRECSVTNSWISSFCTCSIVWSSIREKEHRVMQNVVIWNKHKQNNLPNGLLPWISTCRPECGIVPIFKVKIIYSLSYENCFSRSMTFKKRDRKLGILNQNLAL